MKSNIAIVCIAVLTALNANAVETSPRTATPPPLQISDSAAFAVTMSRWPVWSVRSGWSLFAGSGINNGLLNPIPTAAVGAILAPLWDPWLHSDSALNDQSLYGPADEESASAELQLSLRPGVSMLWELTNDGALFNFDAVTVSFGLRIRF